MPSAFVFDPDRCTGCQACELACSIENDLGPERSWREVVTFNDVAIPDLPRFHLSLACNHCAEPACMYSCPALAYSREASTGAVLLDPDRCIGCRYCSWACPYGAPRFEEDRGVMGKCTFCSHRLADGLKPACATLCPTGALDYGDLPESELTASSPGFPQTNLGPSIRITPPKRSAHVGAVAAASADEPADGLGLGPPETGIDLRSEWSLAAFTFLLALLFALYAAGLAGALRVSPIAFAGVAAFAAACSLSHLGRPGRAWRAGLNLRRSWLSREVMGFGAFAAGGTAALALGSPQAMWFGDVLAAVGLVTLASADMVYRPVYRGWHPLIDGSGVVITGLYLAGLFLGSPWLAGGPWLVKVGMLPSNALRSRGRESAGTSAVLTAVSGALGLALPAVAWIAWDFPLPAWVIAGAIVGEAGGRLLFYTHLEAPSPGRQARADLAGRLATLASRARDPNPAA